MNYQKRKMTEQIQEETLLKFVKALYIVSTYYTIDGFQVDDYQGLLFIWCEITDTYLSIIKNMVSKLEENGLKVDDIEFVEENGKIYMQVIIKFEND